MKAPKREATGCIDGVEKSAAVKDEKVTPAAALALPAEELEPCVMAVDDSSVDRAVITAILRRSKYRGLAPPERIRFPIPSFLILNVLLIS